MDTKHSPLLYQTAEELKAENERRFWEDAAVSLGGVAGGAVLGTALIPGYEHFKEKRIEKAIKERSANFARNQEILRTLRDLHTKKVSWEDVEPEAKPALEQMYAEHKTLLENPTELQRALREPPPVQIFDMPGIPRSSLKQILPSLELMRNPLSMLQHPLPATLGLIGGFVGGYAMDKIRMKRMYDKMKSWEESETNGST